MKRLFILLLSLSLLLIFPLSYASIKASQQSSKGRAVSLKVLQERVTTCMARRNCPDSILQLSGIKTVLGYVIDERNNDLVLIGKTDNTSPPLHLEDFVIALRNEWMKYTERRGNTYYYSNPGCSIDPDQKVLGELQQVANRIFGGSDPDEVQRSLKQWHRVCRQPQRVRVLGIPFDTRFARVMVEADYYMKRLVDGSVTLDIDGFTSLTDMTLNIIRQDIGSGGAISIPAQSMHRFWFYPGENSYLENKGITLIQKSKVILLTEEEFLTERGEIAGTGRPNSLANKFAGNFSERYAEIALREPIYAELEGLFRFVALAKLVKHKDAAQEAGVSLDYLLRQYPVRNTSVSRTLPGRSNVKEFNQKSETVGGYRVLYLWLPSCGGVSIDINIKDSDIVRDKNLFDLKEAVLKARPLPDSLYWDFPALGLVENTKYRDTSHIFNSSSSVLPATR